MLHNTALALISLVSMSQPLLGCSLYFYQEPLVLVLKNKLNWVLVLIPQRNEIRNPILGQVL
jgi:hypothetical protein